MGGEIRARTTIISDKLMCRHDGLMSGVSAERFAELAGELEEVREPKLIRTRRRHLTFPNEPNQTLNECVKTPKPLKPNGALFNLAWLRSFLPHSQTALQGRISAPCVPETCLWLLRYSTLDDSCLVVLMAAVWLPLIPHPV